MYTQIELAYGFDALEPHIDALTMETHYGKHHAAYTKNLNDAAQKAGVEGKKITELLASLDSVSDEALRKAIRNNGGGFYNHNLYFDIISPDGEREPKGTLAEAINKEFGSFEAFKEKVSAAGAGQFGSGWAWLSSDKSGKLYVSATPNQDNPIMEGKGLVPIFGIDVWEHAYYLKYKNLRADYIKAFFNVVDWKKVSDNYEKVKA